jgi:hypothetical protein
MDFDPNARHRVTVSHPGAVAVVLLLWGTACNLKPAGPGDGGPDGGDDAGTGGSEVDVGFPFDLPSFGTGGSGSGGSSTSSVSGGRSGTGAGGSSGTGGSASGTGGSGSGGSANPPIPGGGGGQGGGTPTNADAGRIDVPAAETGGGGTAQPPMPPATWQETWFEHVESLQLGAYDDHAVVYFDAAVTRTAAAWVHPFASKVWKYVKETYGPFGADPRAFVVVHQGMRYPGGHAAGYQDARHGNRNVFDVNQATWTQGQAAMNLIVRQAASVIENHNNAVRGSAGFAIWGFKFGDLLEYDIYMGLGMMAEAKASHDRLLVASDSSPRAGSFWFRDWHLPLWTTQGKSRVFAKFFSLLAQRYPTVNEGTGRRYARTLTFGEYVHFMSGAAGSSLKSSATQAFGWTPDMEAQFNKARADFPAVTY